MSVFHAKSQVQFILSLTYILFADGNRLNGTIPSHLSKMNKLRYMNLGKKKFMMHLLVRFLSLNLHFTVQEKIFLLEPSHKSLDASYAQKQKSKMAMNASLSLIFSLFLNFQICSKKFWQKKKKNHFSIRVNCLLILILKVLK